MQEKSFLFSTCFCLEKNGNLLLNKSGEAVLQIHIITSSGKEITPQPYKKKTATSTFYSLLLDGLNLLPHAAEMKEGKDFATKDLQKQRYTQKLRQPNLRAVSSHRALQRTSDLEDAGCQSTQLSTNYKVW